MGRVDPIGVHEPRAEVWGDRRDNWGKALAGGRGLTQMRVLTEFAVVTAIGKAPTVFAEEYVGGAHAQTIRRGAEERVEGVDVWPVMRLGIAQNQGIVSRRVKALPTAVSAIAGCAYLDTVGKGITRVAGEQ